MPVSPSQSDTSSIGTHSEDLNRKYKLFTEKSRRTLSQKLIPRYKKVVEYNQDLKIVMSKSSDRQQEQEEKVKIPD